MQRYLKLSIQLAGLFVLPVLFAQPARASFVAGGCVHTTNGQFDPGEWNCSSASKIFFPQVGASGGAFLYVDQGQGSNNNLYLMYDYVASTTTSSFFDVFFEVVPDGHAYLVRIPDIGSLLAFERPIGNVAPLLPNGAFDIGISSGWDPLTIADLALAQFQGAVGFGPSPDSGTPHSMAEFRLTIARPAAGPVPGQNGIYDPAPAFWGASEKSTGGADPPISSGIFQLNPDGTTFVLPALGPGGAPLQQGSVTPEPATASVLLAGLLGLAALGRRRLAR